MSSPFSLLKTRRFLPFFITQSLSAFNDNLFKQSLILAVLFHLSIQGDRLLLVNLCALLFILPFLLFSALGGQLGEQYDKARLMRWLKGAEVLILLVGAAGFLTENVPVMLAALFAMGTRSALFGPAKYSILPQHLDAHELMGGNAFVEMGTFLAILGGTIGAGVLLSQADYAYAVTGGVLVTAAIGFLASQGIPSAPPVMQGLSLDWNVFRQTWRILRMGLGQTPAVSRSLLGNSWFWFVGAVYLTQIPAYAKDFLHGDESVVSLILTLFSVGIALGSLLCDRLSRGRVEMGLVPLGALGLTLFSLLLYSASPDNEGTSVALNWLAIIGEASTWPILLCILGLGTFGGLYIVPLYAVIQSRTPIGERARVIAATNILNALLMVCSALLTMLLLGGEDCRFRNCF
ncbi:MFS transporter [Pseudomonas duriflava]|uniref:MFS transporter n=1 Tax=Pseudomonas duriflava TaxID=459528 RepID=A0A562QFW5_9PSED|nr:MFS transporter [Pseudomonas duriflava]